MELRVVAVRDRIADLQRTAAELRLERAVAADRSARRPRPLRIVGAWLIGLGTAIGGASVVARPSAR